MDSKTLALYGLSTAAAAAVLLKARSRYELSRAKHASLTGHVRMSKFIASLVPYYEIRDDEFFAADGAPGEVRERRRGAFAALAADYRQRFAKTAAQKDQMKDGVSDLQFTDAYRTPFPFSRRVREELGSSPILASSKGVVLTDIDGNDYLDVAGSYGVNTFGYDFYKSCMDKGADLVRDLGPVLGAYHPIVAYNVDRIRQISGQDEVSFHMSGTEAVMQAVRLARYHTGRTHVVRFSGAYHGWWGDVQPGIGNPIRARETYTLAEMSEATLRVLRRRRNIACVLVNPCQALHPNAGPPADSALVDSSRSASFDRRAYGDWLRRLKEVCSERCIVLIFDEIFVGFRLALGGAQEYFGVKADMVTYGKTLGGGFPVGVVTGRHDLMKRYRDDRPANVCFARGTFNSHPYVMGAMHEFLRRLELPEYQALYRDLDATWNGRAESLNRLFEQQGLPVRVANMSTIWTVLYERPSRYNWIFQYYLRKHGLFLSWIGTGRLIFSLNYTVADFEEVSRRFVAAASEMMADGWWWHDDNTSAARTPIRRQMLREMIERGYLGRRPAG